MRKRIHRHRFLFPFVLSAVLASGCGGGGEGDVFRKLTPLERQIYLDPTPISTALRFDRVAQGDDASCMLTPAGEAWCWGSNAHGQLGATTAKSCQSGIVACTWQPVRAQAALRFASLSSARMHSCGIDLAGQAWCWGFGMGGQLGDGLRTDSAAPVAVAGKHRFVQIDAGRGALLSCALDAAGAAWCWGPGDSGGLGNGTTDGAAAPVQVLASQPFTSVGAGDNHGCGLDTSQHAWCWGRNPYGVLGRGVSGASLLPAAVAGGHQFASLWSAAISTAASLRQVRHGAGALRCHLAMGCKHTATCLSPWPAGMSSPACRLATSMPVG